MSRVLGHSITYRIAVNPNAGRKVMMLQMLRAEEASISPDSTGCLHPTASGSPK